MLAQFLTDTFPGLDDPALITECWILNAIRSEHPQLNVLSDALEVVCQHGETNSFRSKLAREHPMDRNHNHQHDARVRDCLTEACAFAWAVSRELRTPAFCDESGAPDLLLADGGWIEVKAIHRSLEDEERMTRMLAGDVDSGTVRQPGSGLYEKFRSSLTDAVKKFERQGHHETSTLRVVFFNLATLDVPQIPLTDQVLDSLAKWAGEAERAIRDDESLVDVKLVMCYSYDWKAPFRDPFGEQSA